MILGNPKRIDLGTSSFRRLREENSMYVDKTRFIEHFLDDPNMVQLVVRQRRLGKSLNLDTLRLFLSDKEDSRELFAGTYIETSPFWEKRGLAPVFLFDFKGLERVTYKERIREQVLKHIFHYVGAENLNGYAKLKFDNYLNGSADNPEGLLLLTEIVYDMTGKRSYILIDEYDKLLTRSYKSDAYYEIKEYETDFLTNGLKGNNYLEKAMLTGVMRVSRESILSGLNNLRTYDLFADSVYADDFGFTEEEMDAFGAHYDFDKDAVRRWYNGVKIGGKAVYNTFSVASYLSQGKFDNYWGQSGTIEMVVDLLNDKRRDTVAALLNGESIDAPANKRISLHELTNTCDDSIFYSFLLQTGYLSLETELDSSGRGIMKIPNIELMNVWRDFILSYVVKDEGDFRTLFDNVSDPYLFARDIEGFISDRLSYFDLESSTQQKKNEKLYHIFVLGMLSAYNDTKCAKPPMSNRESGDGRYDILFERRDFCVIFEFKAAGDADKLDDEAADGLRQIDEKRYFAEAPKDKPLYKVAIAFHGKLCRAAAS